MKASIKRKLEQLAERHEEIAARLADPETIGDQDRFRTLSMEYSQNEQVVRLFDTYQQTESAREQAEEMVEDGDDELRAMARDEVALCEQTLETLEKELQLLHQENQSLKDRSQREWFIAGAGVLLGGLLLGLIIPKFSWRKKSSW